MATRRGQKRCRRNCPETEAAKVVNDAANKAAGQLAKATIDPRFVSVNGEAERLWKHVLFGTGTCVGMMEGYAALEMPGDPLPHLHNLVGRLVTVIQTLERKAQQ